MRGSTHLCRAGHLSKKPNTYLDTFWYVRQMHFSPPKLCTKKMELALHVKFFSRLPLVTRTWRRTLTNGSDVKYVSVVSTRPTESYVVKTCHWLLLLFGLDRWPHIPACSPITTWGTSWTRVSWSRPTFAASACSSSTQSSSSATGSGECASCQFGHVQDFFLSIILFLAQQRSRLRRCGLAKYCPTRNNIQP